MLIMADNCYIICMQLLLKPLQYLLTTGQNEAMF